MSESDGRENGFDSLVLFGISGDLAKKKLFPSLYQLEAQDKLRVPIVGFASSPWDNDKLRERCVESLRDWGKPVDPAVQKRLLDRLSYVQGNYEDPATFTTLAAEIGRVKSKRPLFYLAIPPALFDDVITSLSHNKLHTSGGVVVEKPFGRDLASAQELNACLRRAFPEKHTFRIDHYLGKEAIQDILVFRFANTMFEPVWNRRYVSSVQLTMAESIGVEDRGSFYDSVGTMRDVFQNHALQIIGLLAMEPPVDTGADALRDEQLKVLKAIHTIHPPTDIVRGQYRGFLDEAGVAPGSQTETFFMAKLKIESWRWAGVPFFVRAGKHLPVTSTEALIRFHHPPRLLFAEDDTPVPHSNSLLLRLREPGGVQLSVQAKKPGERFVSQTVNLDVDFGKALGGEADAYERLLYDALNGNQMLFARQDNVEEQWRVVEDVLEHAPAPHLYDKGTWGPEESFYPLADYQGWHDPRDDPHPDH